MTRTSWLALPIAASLVMATPLLQLGHAAAQTPRTLDIGGPPTDSTAAKCATDSIVTAVLAAFNMPAAVHMSGDGSVDAGQTIRGNYAVLRGGLRIDGTIQGNVIVLNGDLRIRSTGSVTGAIMVLGGHLTVDPGATISAKPFECEQEIPFTKRADGSVQRGKDGSSIVGSLSSSLTGYIGPWRFTPHLGIGQYNRVEGIPLQGGVNVLRPFTNQDTVRAQAYLIARTADDPSRSRPRLGWFASADYVYTGMLPATITLSGGSALRPTSDQPFSSIESGTSAFVLREDYNDWYQSRGFKITATIHPTTELSFGGAFSSAHQTTVLAVDAFSVLRNTEPWRPNPLIDDGRYQITSGRMTWDARDERHHPSLTWYGRLEVRHVSSNELTPVSLPVTIRDAMPTSGYGETEGDLDLRAWLRLDPEEQIGFRLVGGGHLGGDPMTIQNRRAIGGADPLLGYDFRAINCDRRRKVDPAMPALCDRSIAVQAEYRRELPIDLSTRVGGYNVGIRHPSLIFFADIGSAWLTGDTAGRVPIGNIQALREWRSDVGVGLTNGPLGLYLAKALADSFSPKLLLLLNKRF